MRVFSLLTDSIHSGFVEVEYHSRFQIPAFQILGLPAPEIQEAKERIMAAFASAEVEFPKKRVIINLAPASIKKSGTGHDLAIALKIVFETLEQELSDSLIAWGELSLMGEVKSVGRMAGLITQLLKHYPESTPLLYLTSKDCADLETLLSWREFHQLPNPKNLRVKVVQNLKDALDPVEPIALTIKPYQPEGVRPDRNDLLALSKSAERILKISLVGKHHVLLLGPKGIGKSESIRWYQALLPDSEPAQTWDRIVVSENKDIPFDFKSPVRRVHAQVRPAHLLGSFREKGYQPGELALAHGGLFIADEFMEWPRDSKETLREPLQTQKIFLTRVRGQIECEASFQMIATGNLCPCGGLPEPFRGNTEIPSKKFKCKCKLVDVESYFQKLSGPVLDRIDLSFIMTDTETVRVGPDHPTKLEKEIKIARAFALEHFGAVPSMLSPQWLEQETMKNPALNALLTDVTSLRARHKIMRVARSIQAIENSPSLKEEHVFEAKWYRLQSVGSG